MQACTLLQTDNHASNRPLSFFAGRMPFLPPNQQRQSTEEISTTINKIPGTMSPYGYSVDSTTEKNSGILSTVSMR